MAVDSPLKKLYLFVLAALLLVLSGCGTLPTKTEELGHFSPDPEYGHDQLIKHAGFHLGYSYRHRQALWVSYELLGDDLEKPQFTRADKFAPDPQISTDPVQPKEYARTGFDRGHLAPAADMSYSQPTLLESFYMSNISPQKPGCNRGIWKKLETQVREWAREKRRIFVVTGPMFSDQPTRMGSGRIPVPEAFYKVLFTPDEPREMIGFIIPNCDDDRPLKFFALPVDDIEQRTRLDFFGGLADELENRLESRINYRFWFPSY